MGPSQARTIDGCQRSAQNCPALDREYVALSARCLDSACTSRTKLCIPGREFVRWRQRRDIAIANGTGFGDRDAKVYSETMTRTRYKLLPRVTFGRVEKRSRPKLAAIPAPSRASTLQTQDFVNRLRTPRSSHTLRLRT